MLTFRSFSMKRRGTVAPMRTRCDLDVRHTSSSSAKTRSLRFLRHSAQLLGARVRIAKWENRTPLTGVAIFLDSKGHERRLDVMASVYGMNSDDIRRTAIEAELLVDGDRQVHVWVMHPERCMESRIHNSALSNVEYDATGRVVGMTLTNVSWLLDRDGEITITLPAGHVGPDDLARALRPTA
jgi:hypothetical protein